MLLYPTSIPYQFALAYATVDSATFFCDGYDCICDAVKAACRCVSYGSTHAQDRCAVSNPCVLVAKHQEEAARQDIDQREFGAVCKGPCRHGRLASSAVQLPDAHEMLQPELALR